jgi:ribonuclease VapC
MILDSSAIVAIMLAEPGHQEIRERIGAAEILGVGAPTVAESGIVLSARIGRDARPELNEFLRVADAEIIAFGLEHFHAALDAFLRFGKGRHPASLNFGDCLSYAIASVAGLPLLYTGNDFSQTDIPSAGAVRLTRPQKP